MDDSEKIEQPANPKLFEIILYLAIGIAAASGLLLLLYWGLRLNSSLASFITNTRGAPAYFWTYIALTFGTILLFAINTPLLIHHWRKFGFDFKIFGKGSASNSIGSAIGVAASACPVCGSTILASIGIAGGLASFPFQGLELKLASFAFMALALLMTIRGIKKAECKDGSCQPQQIASSPQRNRDILALMLMLIVIFTFSFWNLLRTDPIVAGADALKIAPESTDPDINALIEKVIPSSGFASQIALKDSVIKLVAEGVIDEVKFNSLYESREGLPEELRAILKSPMPNPIHLTRENANIYLNVLWPLGLANYMAANSESPVNGDDLFNFASTGGWTLGKEENGGAYFNKFKIVNLTPDQEALVVKIAQNTYRPCCGNSTFFQDCNHGSALLGLLQLGVSQGLSEDELYREALAFNSFWFPDTYIKTALYFEKLKSTPWENVDPKLVMSKDFSSIQGWHQNVRYALEKSNLMPQIQGGAGCGV